MNSWTAVGFIFVVLGIIMLFVGIVLGALAAGEVAAIGFGLSDPLGKTIFIAVFLPYDIVSRACFVIGVVGVYVGTTRKESPTSGSPISPKPASSVLNQVVSPARGPKLGRCPSCGQPIIFNERIHQWYCPNENAYI